MVKTWRFLFAFSLYCIGLHNVSAHDPGLSSLKISQTNNDVFFVLTFARGDIEELISIDQNEDSTISQTELQQARPQLQDLSRDVLQCTFSNAPLALSALGEVKVDDQNNIEFYHHLSRVSGELGIESLLLPKLPLGHRQFVSVYDTSNQLTGSFLLSASNNRFTFSVSDRPDVELPSNSGNDFKIFLGLGVKHILIGYDHLLFLLGLLLLPVRWTTLVKIITSFTLAHSITLALAALKKVEISSSLVEPAIALSICYVGLENLWNKKTIQWRWVLTFFFGLIHGFGFAGVLSELGLGQSGSQLAVRLIAFNLGVEFGQLIFAACALPLLYWAHKHPKFDKIGIPVISITITLAGLYWFVERVFF
jgi:hydrogenase/urease accessory protein HupE